MVSPIYNGVDENYWVTSNWCVGWLGVRSTDKTSSAKNMCVKKSDGTTNNLHCNGGI